MTEPPFREIAQISPFLYEYLLQLSEKITALEIEIQIIRKTKETYKNIG